MQKVSNLRLEQFLSIAHGLGISTVPVLFDDCAFAGREPYLGKQDDPVPGVHNGGWTPSPGLKLVVNGSARPALASYVTDVVGSLGGDERILFWDLYNEPGNSRMGEQSLPLMEEAFDWARQAGPEQPLTVGAWQDGPSFSSRMSKKMLALSDIISFHCYGQEQMEDSVSSCRSYGRPVICSEWLRRTSGNTVADALPLFARGQVGWYNWGLVAGRTQTFLDWRSKAGDPVPAIWQHDMFHADGTAYDSHEIELIKQFDFSDRVGSLNQSGAMQKATCFAISGGWCDAEISSGALRSRDETAASNRSIPWPIPIVPESSLAASSLASMRVPGRV